MDWAVKLVDVNPCGQALNIAEGILKSTTTDGIVEIDMLGTANVFLPGHKIRLDVTSANFPMFARAEQAGSNAVRWAGSAIILPVVPLPASAAEC